MNTNKRWAFDCLILIWSVTFLASVAYAEPGDVRPVEPEPEPEVTPRVFQSAKPVTCTSDPYDMVKQNFQQSHGEVGLMRWVSDVQTAVEIIGNTSTGTITILEHLATGATCFISIGKGLEVNSLVFQETVKGIKTSY